LGVRLSKKPSVTGSDRVFRGQSLRSAFEPEFPALALNGLSDAEIIKSASAAEVDMPSEHVECPLMTQSGH
jgi:hypothetical protein